MSVVRGTLVCINDALTDDELRAVLERLSSVADRDVFGLVCKRWLMLQSYERRRLRARAGPAMLRRMADRFSGIVELDLSQSSSRSFYPGVTDSDLAVIASGFPRLRVLSLSNCKGITDTGLAKLGNGLSSLYTLDVTCCRKITDKGLAAIAMGCGNLRALYLAGCRSLTDNLFLALSKGCPQLEELNLLGCFSITDNGISILLDGCRNIKCLNVSKCTKIRDSGISRVAEVCSKSLTQLELEDLIGIGDDSLLALAKSCPNIETIVLGGCRGVSDEAIKLFIQSCGHSLRRLRVDWCLNITDASLSCILSSCRNLVALDIGCCEKVTDMSFQGFAMAGSVSKLKAFKINNCPGITVLGLGLILEFCLSLEYLDVTSCVQITKHGCEQALLQFPAQCKVNFSESLSEMHSLRDLFF